MKLNQKSLMSLLNFVIISWSHAEIILTKCYAGKFTFSLNLFRTLNILLFAFYATLKSLEALRRIIIITLNFFELLSCCVIECVIVITEQHNKGRFLEEMFKLEKQMIFGLQMSSCLKRFKIVVFRKLSAILLFCIQLKGFKLFIKQNSKHRKPIKNSFHI